MAKYLISLIFLAFGLSCFAQHGLELSDVKKFKLIDAGGGLGSWFDNEYEISCKTGAGFVTVYSRR